MAHVEKALIIKESFTLDGGDEYPDIMVTVDQGGEDYVYIDCAKHPKMQMNLTRRHINDILELLNTVPDTEGEM